MMPALFFSRRAALPIDIDLALKVTGPIAGGLATKLLSDLIEKRPRLVCFYGHSSGINLPADTATSRPIRVHTHSVVVANQGREPATNVRLGHQTLPSFEIFPDVAFTRSKLPGGTEEILIPALAPKEQVTVNYLYFAPVTYDQINTYVKSDGGFARVLRVLPTPQLPRWMIVIAWCLIAYGAAALIYTAFAMFLWDDVILERVSEAIGFGDPALDSSQTTEFFKALPQGAPCLFLRLRRL
jgi:hypothetical protein